MESGASLTVDPNLIWKGGDVTHGSCVNRYCVMRADSAVSFRRVILHPVLWCYHYVLDLLMTT